MSQQEKCRISGQFKVNDGLHKNHTGAILTCCVAFSSCMGYMVIHLTIRSYLVVEKSVFSFSL